MSTVYVDILQSFLSEIFAGKYNDKFYDLPTTLSKRYTKLGFGKKS